MRCMEPSSAAWETAAEPPASSAMLLSPASDPIGTCHCCRQASRDLPRYSDVLTCLCRLHCLATALTHAINFLLLSTLFALHINQSTPRYFGACPACQNQAISHVQGLQCSLTRTNPGLLLLILTVPGDLSPAVLQAAQALGRVMEVEDVRVGSRNTYEDGRLCPVTSDSLSLFWVTGIGDDGLVLCTSESRDQLHMRLSLQQWAAHELLVHDRRCLLPDADGRSRNADA